jgi:hypothetical protein
MALGYTNSDYFKANGTDVSSMVNPDGSYTPEYQKWLDWNKQQTAARKQYQSGSLSKSDYGNQMNELSKSYGFYWKNNGQDVVDWNNYLNGGNGTSQSSNGNPSNTLSTVINPNPANQSQFANNPQQSGLDLNSLIGYPQQKSNQFGNMGRMNNMWGKYF